MQQKNHKTNRHYWIEEKKTQIKYSIMLFKCSFKLKPPKFWWNYLSMRDWFWMNRKKIIECNLKHVGFFLNARTILLWLLIKCIGMKLIMEFENVNRLCTTKIMICITKDKSSMSLGFCGWNCYSLFYCVEYYYNKGTLRKKCTFYTQTFYSWF